MKVEGTNLIANAQQRLSEAEASMLQALGFARAALVLVENENLELRRENLARRTEFFTEREFAELLKVSVSTIARLRRAAKLEHLQVGSQIRYSSVHVEKAHEIFGREPKTRSTRLKSFRKGLTRNSKEF
jgi:excisionase family DNA binding protein